MQAGKQPCSSINCACPFDSTSSNNDCILGTGAAAALVPEAFQTWTGYQCCNIHATKVMPT